MTETILQTILARDNDYSSLEEEFRRQTGTPLVRSLDDAIAEYAGRTSPVPFYPQGISIVIPSYNGMSRLSLEATLTALNHQTYLQNPANRMEVIVVDDGSTDGTDKMIERLNVRYRLKYVKQANAGPSHARNAGIALAENDVILFMDNDVVPYPHTVEEHARIHATIDGVLVCGERDYVMPADPHIQVAAINSNPCGIHAAQRVANAKDPVSQRDGNEWRVLWAKITNFLKDMTGDIPPELKSYFCDAMRFTQDKIGLYSISANLSVRRRYLFDVGGFIDFPGWGVEDTCLGAELFGLGLYFIPSPSSLVHHIEHEIAKPDGAYTGDPLKDILINLERYRFILAEPSEPRRAFPFSSNISFTKLRTSGLKTWYLATHDLERQYLHPHDKQTRELRKVARRNTGAQYELGHILMGMGRTVEARYTFYDLLAKDPSNVGAMVDLGLSFIHEGNNGGGFFWFERAYAIAPDNPFVSRVYHQLKQQA